MKTKINKNRPTTAALSYTDASGNKQPVRVVDFLEVQFNDNNEPSIQTGYWCPQDLLELMTGADIELEDIVSRDSINPQGKMLPAFKLKCNGRDIGGAFANTGDAKYKYKLRMSNAPGDEKSYQTPMPYGIHSMINFVNEGMTRSGQARKPGLSIYFYPMKDRKGYNAKLMTDDYSKLIRETKREAANRIPSDTPAYIRKPQQEHRDVPF